MAGRATPLVLLLLLAIAAMGYYAIAPDVRRARDGIRVELAARAARRCDAAVQGYVRHGRVGAAADVTPKMVDEFYARLRQPPVSWPPEADLSTLDLSDTNGASVVVLLSGGPRRVTAADLAAAE